MQKLVAHWASVEADNVYDFGHSAYREKNGSSWKHHF